MELTTSYLKYLKSRGFEDETKIKEAWDLAWELYPEFSTQRITLEVITKEILQKDWNPLLKERIIKAGKKDLLY